MKKEINNYKSNFEKEKKKLFPIDTLNKNHSQFITTYEDDYKPPILKNNINKENQYIQSNRLSKNNIRVQNYLNELLVLKKNL